MTSLWSVPHSALWPQPHVDGAPAHAPPWKRQGTAWLRPLPTASSSASGPSWTETAVAAPCAAGGSHPLGPGRPRSEAVGFVSRGCVAGHHAPSGRTQPAARGLARWSPSRLGSVLTCGAGCSRVVGSPGSLPLWDRDPCSRWLKAGAALTQGLATWRPPRGPFAAWPAGEAGSSALMGTEPQSDALAPCPAGGKHYPPQSPLPRTLEGGTPVWTPWPEPWGAS